MRIFFTTCLLLCTQVVWSQEWIPVKGPKPFGISGMAFIDQTSDASRFLIVHDNKATDEGRLAIVTDYGLFNQYTYLFWPDSNNLPKDLESITSIPDLPGQFMVMTSLGKVWHITVDTNLNVSILRTFTVPGVLDTDNFEGLSLQRVNTNLLMVWGHRGDDSDPGMIHWAIFDLKTAQFTAIGKEPISVAWPTKSHVRHISDLKLNPTGILYITSASDPGDDGPFTSAVYLAGVFSTWDKEVHFRKNTQLTRFFTFYNRKTEAIEFVPGPKGGIIFGSDDENQGGAICKTWP
ncbi:MAG: hypothetical protein KDC45_15215 [Bacteroidetes bacterium]|nr:hypothetical protein [Bacteroidota bacterium]